MLLLMLIKFLLLNDQRTGHIMEWCKINKATIKASSFQFQSLRKT